MPIIDEQTAWKILQNYAQKCQDIDRLSLYAIYAVGSLPGGYYRPGQSDIDAILIVADDSEITWGTCEEPGKKLADLNLKFRREYGIPKDFGPFPIQPHELLPPYDPGKELMLEIARLKIQSKLVYGTFSLKDIPLPDMDAFVADFQHFEEWAEKEFVPMNPPEKLTVTQCANIILLHLNRYLIVEKDTFQFDKTQIIPLCLTYKAGFLDKQQLSVVQRHLEQGEINATELKRLRQYVVDLRLTMNKVLNIHIKGETG